MASHLHSLSNFLALSRSEYLDSVKAGKARDWTVVIGNEAGDLDSAASSIAYSYLASTLLKRPTVALLQTPRSDLRLRAENLHAYEVARLHPSLTDLLFVDDIPTESFSHLSESSFALVDHNHLASRFSPQDHDSPPKVISIIDHHEDEGFHSEAEVRLITVPVGSCASLVTQYFMEAWDKSDLRPPKELASLLLCAILIDTHGLKPKGKAVVIDHNAVEFLLPKSSFASSFAGLRLESIRDNDELKTLTRALEEHKGTVAHLSTPELLRRDYKEYTYESSPHFSSQVTVGLATVPISPKEWFQREASPKFWDSMDAWINERNLDTLGVLCTYCSPKTGYHKRQNIWIVRGGRERFLKALWEGLEACEDLQLERRDMGKKLLSEGMTRGPNGDIRTRNGSVARIWKQKNAKLTRKAIAPLVKGIVENA